MSEIAFLWSDAWLLQAIAIASHQAGTASLSEVIGAADAVNHAMLTSDELNGGLLRLTKGGFVEEVGERFRLTARVPAETIATLVTAGWQEGRNAALTLLKAEVWSAAKNVADPRNKVSYPGLTPERMSAAEKEYRRRLKLARSD